MNEHAYVERCKTEPGLSFVIKNGLNEKSLSPLAFFLSMSTNRKQAFKHKDYLSAETGTIIKSFRTATSIALVYPNTYYLGMSNLGFQSLYAWFNRDPQTVCERVFLPDDVVLGNYNVNDPLRSLENNRPVADFDCVAFSISFENDYLYLPKIFEMAGLKFFNHERSESDPIVIAGGAAITINPEPIRPFCDLLFVGEAEEAVDEIVSVLKEDLSRELKIEKLGKIEGMYIAANVDFSNLPTVPSSICPASLKPNIFETRVPLAHLRHYKRRVPKDINAHAVETVVYTPNCEFGKLSLIEVQRGCGRGCKFCAEGFIYTPFRERSFDLIKEQVLRGLKHRDKIGLIGADLLVYPQIIELFDFIHKSGGTFSPSSVRVDGMTDDIVQRLATSGHRTMAIAPEAGSDELRRKTNKKFNNASILSVIDNLIRHDIPNIKMYLMIGLPHETDDDILQTIDMVDNARHVVLSQAKAKGRVGQLTLSLNPFIPKPRTPYQIGNFEGIEKLEAKIDLIKSKLLPKGGIKIYYENPFYAYIQALLSNGTTKVNEYLLSVHKNGGRLKQALKEFEINDHEKSYQHKIASV